MNQQIAYKVVQPFGSKYISSIGIRLGNNAVVYEHDKLIVPKVEGSKLFVFLDIKLATQFKRANGGVILKVIANNPTPRTVRLGALEYLEQAEVIKKFWMLRRPPTDFTVGKTFVATSPCPTGTYVCDSLWVVGEIYYETENNV